MCIIIFNGKSDSLMKQKTVSYFIVFVYVERLNALMCVTDLYWPRKKSSPQVYFPDFIPADDRNTLAPS